MSHDRVEAGNESTGRVEGVEFDRHVSPEEAAEAVNPDVGDGTPEAAPEFEWPEPGLAAYRKALSVLAVGLLGWLATQGIDFNEDVEKAILALVEAFVVWRVPNER